MVASSSPFLVRAVGSSSQVAGAFSTTINSYRAGNGQTFFSEAAPVRVPAALAGTVAGVVGLANTAQELPLDIPTSSGGSKVAHYGGGPDGSGLTPSQLDGIYGAGPALAAGAKGQGKGVTMAVFELAGYNASGHHHLCPEVLRPELQAPAGERRCRRGADQAALPQG